MALGSSHAIQIESWSGFGPDSWESFITDDVGKLWILIDVMDMYIAELEWSHDVDDVDKYDLALGKAEECRLEL